MFLSKVPEADVTTADGYDIQWATNALGQTDISMSCLTMAF